MFTHLISNDIDLRIGYKRYRCVWAPVFRRTPITHLSSIRLLVCSFVRSFIRSLDRSHLFAVRVRSCLHAKNSFMLSCFCDVSSDMQSIVRWQLASPLFLFSPSTLSLSLSLSVSLSLSLSFFLSHSLTHVNINGAWSQVCFNQLSIRPFIIEFRLFIYSLIRSDSFVRSIIELLLIIVGFNHHYAKLAYEAWLISVLWRMLQLARAGLASRSNKYSSSQS
jgi:hypothetical protein